jgi:hypothetical protein
MPKGYVPSLSSPCVPAHSGDLLVTFHNLLTFHIVSHSLVFSVAYNSRSIVFFSFITPPLTTLRPTSQRFTFFIWFCLSPWDVVYLCRVRFQLLFFSNKPCLVFAVYWCRPSEAIVLILRICGWTKLLGSFCQQHLYKMHFCWSADYWDGEAKENYTELGK